jgi:hypothetical protein
MTPEPVARQLADDLVEGGEHESVELDFNHGPVAAQRHADGRTDQPGLRQGGVDHPVVTELLLEMLGDPEHSAEFADVLAIQQHMVIGGQGVPQAGVDRLDHRQL